MLEEDGSAGLYIVNADGSNLSKLVDVSEVGATDWPALSLSHDQKQVAYFSSDGYLSILTIDGGKMSKLVEVGQEDGQRYVAWSPNDSKITYVSGGNLYLVNADGTGNKKLASPKGGFYTSPGSYAGAGTISDQIRHPIWSADGVCILFDDFTAPSHVIGSPTQVNYRAVYCVDTINERINEVVSRAEVESPTSSGTGLLVHAWLEEEAKDKYIVMSDDGTEQREVPTQWLDETLRLSPDGSAIAYVSQATFPYYLKVMDAGTGEDVPLETEIGIGKVPSWSPDSQHIAYVCYGKVKIDKLNPDEIYIVRRDLSCGFLVYRASDPHQNVVLIAWLSKIV
jgi:Tol biopolymer transport system component